MTTSRDGALAQRIAAHAGFTPRTVTALLGGNQNHVFHVRGHGTDVVVRFAKDDGRWLTDPFDVEAWCLGVVGDRGVEAPRLVDRGRLDGVSYLVLDYVDGATRTVGTPDDWHRLGVYARRTADVAPSSDTPGDLFGRFGRDLAVAWQHELEYNRAALGPNDPLLAAGVYSRAEADALVAKVEALCVADLGFGLVHGDLAPRNLVLAQSAPPVLIDWGSASMGPAPWRDLVTVYGWWVTRDPQTPVSRADLDAFAAGCGIDLMSRADVVESLALLHALDVVRWSLDQKPERFPELRDAARAAVHRSLDGGRLTKPEGP